MTLILLNPHAQGGRAARAIPPFKNWLQTHAPDSSFAAPDKLQESLALLQNLPEGSRVVAVGGDGTLNRWLPALLSRKLTLALVPMGSGNDCARALGLYGLSWTAALQHALNGPARSVDTGLACWTDLQGQSHDTHFFSSLTAGFDSSVGLRALNGPRWLRGLPRYLWATLKELAYLQTWQLSVSADGEPMSSGPALFASSLNTPSFGSGMPAVPHARIDDGQLDALLAGPMGRSGVLNLLPRLLVGKHLTDPRLQCRPFKTLTIDCVDGVPLAADGECLGLATQLRVHCQRARLQAVTRQTSSNRPPTMNA
ncbi:diacylglycerol kinase family protein [Limnohabitans sp. 2KL-17]|uniref:diacylglycerol/lipid kinase family protein n=1 Tax=Limnohabitans sp. 2KL-17 TaxID=1100704 RepID=UPI001304ED25|nr:diacylglycerol kinase family protein [Limnohabitans sp. 2KL-17]